MDLINLFNKEYNKNANELGVNGVELAKQRKNFQPMSEENKKTKPQDYIKEKNTLEDILTLVKNKKLSVNKTKVELKKMLNNPEDLNDFLNLLLKINKGNKKEPKETSSTSSGGYSGQLFGSKITESKCSICNLKNCKCQDKNYPKRPNRRETKEATGSASSGQYSGPSIWSKSTNKKDWGPRRKTQIPDGKFVQVKKKCKKFPYCNQGDINALNIFENKGLKNVIFNISKSYGLTENYIKNIILLEIEKLNKH